MSIVAVTLSDFIIFSTNSGNALLSWGHARHQLPLSKGFPYFLRLLLYMYFQIPFFPFYIPFISPHPLRPLFVTYRYYLSRYDIFIFKSCFYHLHLLSWYLACLSFCVYCCVIWYGRYFSFSMSPYVIPSLFVYTEDEKVYLGISK